MKEALKLALEALELHLAHHEHGCVYLDPAVTAIKEALAQPAQEPVAYCYVQKGTSVDILTFDDEPDDAVDGTIFPLYTTPQPAREESLELFEYWNAVEGWVKIDEVRKHLGSVGCGTIYKTAGEDRVPLYTAPPKREWVKLTDEDIKEIVGPYSGDTPVKGYTRKLFDQIEAKLKEKNI